MAQIDCYQLNKRKRGKVELPDEIFSIKPNMFAIQETVRAQLASRRNPSAHTKERGDVSGGGRKPFRQKGRGSARHGSIRSPIWVGGGVTFGPKTRNFSFRPPAKVRKNGLASALSLYFKEGRIIVVEKFEIAEPKTKKIYEIMKRFNLPSALIVDNKENDNLRLGVRNLQGYKFLAPEGLNVYDILTHDYLILTKNALEVIIRRFNSGK